MAWLAATPAKAKQSRGSKLKDDFGENAPQLALPEIDPFEHVVQYLFEVGPTTGEQALEPTQVKAWCELTGVELSEFEASAMLSLSKTYLSMLHEAREPTCPPPYVREMTREERGLIASRLREAMHQAAKGRKKPQK